MKKSLTTASLAALICLGQADASIAGPLTLAMEDQKLAVTSDTRSTTASKEEEFPSDLQIGGNYTYVSMHPHGHTTFEGNLGGAQLLYNYRPTDNFYGGFKFSWKQGEMEGSSGDRSLLYIDIQERLGYTVFCKRTNWLLTLFTGLGYRHYGQHLPHRAGHSLKLRYNEFYIPVGAMADYEIANCFTYGIRFTWMPQVYPTLTIVPLKGARWNLTNQLGNLCVEMPLTFSPKSTPHFSLIINPFYEYWQDGHTTAKSSNGERLGFPGNTYNFGGVDVNFVFHF